MPLYHSERQQWQRPANPNRDRYDSSAQNRRQMPHHLDGSRRQKGRTDDHIWPIQPSWFAVMIRTFPGGSAWLDRIEFDAVARLQFLRRLHKFYTYPFMRLSSTNKSHASTIAKHIDELESLLEENRSNHLHDKPLRTGSTKRSAFRKSITDPQAGYSGQDKHKRSVSDATLTRENLAMLEADPKSQRRLHHRQGPSYNPSRSHSVPASDPIPDKHRPKRGRRNTAQGILNETRYQRPSKAFQQETAETFHIRRKGQTDAESTHLRNQLRSQVTNSNGYPATQNSRRTSTGTRDQTTSWAPSSTFATVGQKSSYQDRPSRTPSSRIQTSEPESSEPNHARIRVKDV